MNNKLRATHQQKLPYKKQIYLNEQEFLYKLSSRLCSRVLRQLIERHLIETTLNRKTFDQKDILSKRKLIEKTIDKKRFTFVCFCDSTVSLLL